MTFVLERDGIKKLPSLSQVEEMRDGGSVSVCARARARVCERHNKRDLVPKRPVMYHFPFTSLPLTGSSSHPRVVWWFFCKAVITE